MTFENRDVRDAAHILFSAMNRRDLSFLGERLADDAAFDFPGAGTIEGKRRILVFLRLLFRRYPRLEFTVEDILVEGDQACAKWSNEGENSAKEPYMNRGMTLLRVKDGKIVFLSDYFKDTSFVRSP